MLTFVLEAAMRSLLMALAVWTAIRLLRVQAVFAQKVAWVLVLMAAGAMPLVMHTPWLALNRALRIPLRAPALPFARAQAKPLTVQVSAVEDKSTFRAVNMTRFPSKSKPAATHTWHSSTPGADTVTLSQRVMHLPVPDMDLVVRTPVMNAAAAPYWNAQTIRLWSMISYLAIVGLLLLRALAGAAFAWRVWRRATPSGIGGSLTPPVRVRVSKDIATPITVASTILLPADYRTWDDAKLRVVLAHEQSHVRQGDFYLQLLAAVHVAVFWFSPLGWWLRRKLSDLGEALSDRAGLEQAPDAATYAQVLLEFAAIPRRTPLAGVAMARSSNLSGRIERILNDRRFRLAFLGGRRHAILTALLVPTTLVAVVACIRIVPAVEAAQARQAAVIVKPTAGVTVNACSHSSTEAAGQIAFENVPLPENPDDPTAATTFARTSDADLVPAMAVGFGQAVPASPAASAEVSATPEALTLRQRFVLQARANFAPLAFMVPGAQAAPAAPAPEAVAPVAPIAPLAPVVVQDGDDRHQHTHVHVNHDGDDGDKFSIVHENGDGTRRWNGEYNDDLARIQKKMNLRGDYIYFEHDGKSYVVTDPAIVNQANHLFEPNHDLERMQAQLDAKQAELNKRMEQYSPDAAKIKVDSPEMKKKMAELNAKLAELQSESFKKMTVDLNKQINQEVLSNLQEKMGDIQSQIGDIQGQIGEEMGRLGEKQGEIGEEMGRIGEEMGRIGEQQGKIAEEASRKMNSVLDQALRDGKAKPVE